MKKANWKERQIMEDHLAGGSIDHISRRYNINPQDVGKTLLKLGLITINDVIEHLDDETVKRLDAVYSRMIIRMYESGLTPPQIVELLGVTEERVNDLTIDLRPKGYFSQLVIEGLTTRRELFNKAVAESRYNTAMDVVKRYDDGKTNE